MPAVIRVDNLQKSFRVGVQDIPVIKGVSFQIDTGDFAVIVGASGSGKSTLLHMILGLELPSAGAVYILENDIYKLGNEDDRSKFRKRHVGMVYQQPNWIKSITVIENIAFPLLLLGMDKVDAIMKASTLLLDLKLQNWAHYLPTELSGGQQQKIALARALITDPDIIIADEPTGNLDFESGQALMQQLLDLNNKGKTILMVTHDLEYLKYAKTAIKVFDGTIAGIYSGKEKEEFQGSFLGKKRTIADEAAQSITQNN
jgi:putative ABC transport system ATP-binding protein